MIRYFITGIRKILTPNFLYVYINIYVSFVGFTRSFLFMKWMGMNELGIISLVQTIIMFIAMFQLGLLNGGYRIFALNKIEQQKKVNNILFTYFAIIAIIILFFWLIFVVTGSKLIIGNGLLLLSLLLGCITLINNWLTNALIGKQLIKSINNINLISTTLSLLFIPLIKWFGVSGAILSIAVQPLFFVLITLKKHVYFRPTQWCFDTTKVKYILSFGFIPFLAGIFSLLNVQIERWSIAKVLGVSVLGEFYLVFLFTTLFTLIPTALLNIFFPKAIYAYENSRIDDFKSILKQHFYILTCYILTALLLSVFVLPSVVQIILPQHINSIKYIYYILPGLFFLSLCDPLAIILNSAVKLYPILLAGLLGVLLNIFFIAGTIYLDVFSLVNISIIKTIINTLPWVVYMLYLSRNYRVMLNRKTC